MVRPPYFDSNGVKKGAWSKDEDDLLRAYVERFGHPNWRLLPFLAGIPRCGKSCRLRWMNYLKPGLKRGRFSKHEEDLIIRLHNQLGNKWSAIAAKFPGRTDNEIKNYWHAHIDKRGKQINGDDHHTSVGDLARRMEEQSSCDEQDYDDDDNDEGAAMEDDHVNVVVVSPQSSLSDAQNMDISPCLVNNAALQVAPDHHHQAPTFVDQECYDDIGMYMIHIDIYSQPELLRMIWSQEDTFDVQLW